MGSSNTFSKALKHMKGHKPSRLHEEVPTNNTQGLYRVEPNIVVMSHPGVDDPDFSQDGDGASGYDGKDTSGLFMPDGTIRVAEPPGDTTAILGPMASMWYGWGNFSTFGYIRQSDRKMVNLGRITGKLSDWDGVSNFTSYNTGFTIDQAVWFRDVEKYGGISNDPAEANYRAFYPGPPSNTPDQYGRYYCTTTGVPKNRPKNEPPPNVPPEEAGYPWGPESNPENKPKKKKKGEPGEPELTPEGEEKLKNGEPLGIDDFESAADFSAFKNGGGNAAMNQKGQTPGEVMQQGRENIGDYDSGPRNPTDPNPIFPDGNLPNNTPTRRGQGGRELGDTTQRGGDTKQNARNVENNNNALQNVNQFFNDHGETINNVLTVADIALATASIVGVLVPEPATTAAGVAGLASLAGKLRGAANLVRGAQKGRGLARGLRGMQVGATGLKKGGYEALRGGQNLHRGSRGLLSPGGKGVYSAPKVGQVGPGGLRPGSGAGRYVRSGSNPLGGAQGRAGQPGGVVGSITPGGARRIGGIEPQAVVNPQTFRKSQQLFQKVQRGAYPRSRTAAKIRQQAVEAGFKPGQSNIPASQMPGLRSSGGLRSSSGTRGLASGGLGLRSAGSSRGISGVRSAGSSRGISGVRSSGSSSGISGLRSSGSSGGLRSSSSSGGVRSGSGGSSRGTSGLRSSSSGGGVRSGSSLTGLSGGSSGGLRSSGSSGGLRSSSSSGGVRSGSGGSSRGTGSSRGLRSSSSGGGVRSGSSLTGLSGGSSGGLRSSGRSGSIGKAAGRALGKVGRALGNNPLSGAVALNALNASPAKGQIDPQYLDKSGNIDVKKMDDLLRNNPDEWQKQLQRGMSGTPTVLPDIAPSNIPSLSDVESQEVNTLMKDLKGMKPGTSNSNSSRKALLKYAEKMDSSDPRYLDVLDAITGQSGNQSTFGRPKKGGGVMPGKGYSIGGKDFRIGEEVEHLLEEKDNMDKVIEKLMKNPKFKKMLPKLIKHIEDEIELGLMSQMMFDEDGNFAEPPVEEPREKIKSTDVKESHTVDVIRNIKKPVVIEEKKEKVKRRPRVIGSEPRTINSGMMKQAEVPASFKKPEDRMWGKYEQQQNARASQDRKNVVLDYLGNADQAWEYLLDRNAGKRSFAGYFEKDGTPKTIFTDGKVKTVTREEKVGSDTVIFFTDEEGKKGSILQSEYNDMQDKAHTQQMFAEYEATVAAQEETPFDKIVDKLELRAEKNPTNDKVQSMLSSYRALSHLRKEDKKQEAHFTSWKSSIDGTITSNFQSWIDSVGKETADAVTKVALAEKMSSANLFGATLPATGDYDHIDMTFDNTYLDPDNDDIVNGAGSGSGYKGGFPVADGEQDVIQLTGHGEYSASAYTTDQDLTYVDTLSVTAIAGNGTNGGLTPINGLDVYFLGDDDWAGPFQVAPASQSSYANTQITIPEKMRTKNVSIYLYSNTSEYVNGMNLSVRHFGNQTFNVPGLDFTTIRNLFAYDDPGEEHGEDFLWLYFTKRDRNNPSHMKSLGHYYWYNVQAQRLGLVDTNRTGSEGGWWWAQWPSPPVNPEKTYGDSGNNYVGGPEDEDYIKIGEMIWDQFFGTKLWGISNISFKRKAPASVYVPLDSPEAINFMRTAPEMKGLTPAQRLKKLKEMLAAGNEYLIKMLGVSGSTATPGPNEPADYLDGADELLNDVSPEEQAEIEKNLAKLGPEYAEIAAIPAALPLLASPAGQAALALGASAVATLLIQAGINVSGTDWGAAPGRNTVGDLPGRGGTSGGRELTPDQQAEVEAAGNELRDARRALEDLPDDATQSERDMAQERLDRATKNRQRVRNKHKQENKNRKESYEVKSSGKKYLSDSKTFKKQTFSNWYSSMESEISDKVVKDTKKLIEGMTTGSLFNAPLPPAGDTDIVDKQTVFATHDGQNEALVNGEIVLTDDGDNDIVDGEHTAFRQSWLFADASESSHIQITISKGGGTSNWTDRGTQQWDDHVGFYVSDADNFDAPYYYTDNLSSGTHMIPLPGNFKRAFIYFTQFAKLSTSESPGATGTLRIKHVSLKRKTPVSVFVPLDSPEAVNFMRTAPMMQGLTPAQRLMRLKRMLAAGNKYLFQQLGYKGSSATPGDMAQGLPYTDLDDAFDDPYYKGPPPDLDDDSDFDPDDFEYASADWPKGRPGGPPVQAPWNKGWPTAPGGRPYQGPPGTPGGKYPMAKGRKGPRTA